MKQKTIGHDKNWKFLKTIGSIAIPIVLAAAYPLFAYLTNIGGFPLDDAWIHQTYARNLALTGQWFYQPGGGAGGSTSPLWTVLLTPGYWVSNISPVTYTLCLSIFLFTALVGIGYRWFIKAVTADKATCLVSFFALAACWQLNWAAGSGMETILYSLCVVLLFSLLYSENRNAPWWMGLIIGIAVWIRPDAITLLAPVLLSIVVEKIFLKKEIKPAFRIMLAVGIPVLAYGVWNYLSGGAVFPNTFFAKQAEYAEMISAPFTVRFVNVFTPVLTGVISILAPGIIYILIRTLQKKDFRPIVIFLWCVGYVFLYAMRLPVTYQHGRYLIPVIAPLIILGMMGVSQIINDFNTQRLVKRVIYPAWIISILLVSVIFWFKGMFAFRDDVNAINRLMVDSAVWIDQNTSPEAKIAVHDIGAMGYFCDRQIIDLAGLINPEVIPFIRNESKLREYIHQSDADYLVILKDWYPLLQETGKVVTSFTATNAGETGTMLVIKLK